MHWSGYLKNWCGGKFSSTAVDTHYSGAKNTNLALASLNLGWSLGIYFDKWNERTTGVDSECPARGYAVCVLLNFSYSQRPLPPAPSGDRWVQLRPAQVHGVFSKRETKVWNKYSKSLWNYWCTFSGRRLSHRWNGETFSRIVELVARHFNVIHRRFSDK